MKFEIDNNSLLKVCKVIGGFVSNKSWRKVLTAIHIVADEENSTVSFESTNSSRIARWIVSTKVIEGGECNIIFSKKLIYLLKLMEKPFFYNVVIYDEEGVFKANVDGSILILENCKDDFPKTASIFEDKIERCENEPIFDIRELEKTLKSMRESGAITMKFSIPKDERKVVKLVCKPHLGGEPIEAYITTLRDLW